MLTAVQVRLLMYVSDLSHKYQAVCGMYPRQLRQGFVYQLVEEPGAATAACPA